MLPAIKLYFYFKFRKDRSDNFSKTELPTTCFTANGVLLSFVKVFIQELFQAHK